MNDFTCAPFFISIIIAYTVSLLDIDIQTAHVELPAGNSGLLPETNEAVDLPEDSS
jgi:hypothetical protein